MLLPQIPGAVVFAQSVQWRTSWRRRPAFAPSHDVESNSAAVARGVRDRRRWSVVECPAWSQQWWRRRCGPDYAATAQQEIARPAEKLRRTAGSGDGRVAVPARE